MSSLRPPQVPAQVVTGAQWKQRQLLATPKAKNRSQHTWCRCRRWCAARRRGACREQLRGNRNVAHGVRCTKQGSYQTAAGRTGGSADSKPCS